MGSLYESKGPGGTEEGSCVTAPKSSAAVLQVGISLTYSSDVIGASPSASSTCGVRRSVGEAQMTGVGVCFKVHMHGRRKRNTVRGRWHAGQALWS